MTQVRKARNFARQRRWLTAAILALAIGLVGTLTAAAAITGKASPSKAGSAANSLLAAATTVNGDASCGYSGTTQFTESTVMRWAQVNGNGLAATFSAYANDENSTLLGVSGATPNTSSPQHATNATGGDVTQHDALGRPYYPALYITKLSSSGTWTKPGDAIPQAAGDWQQGGTPRNLSAGAAFIDDVFGTWVVGTQTINPSAAPGQVGTLANGPLSTTVNTTHLDSQAGLTKAVNSGDAIVVATAGHTLTFTANAAAAAGATSISVTAKKSNFAFPNGSTLTDTTAQTGNYSRQATLPAKNDWNLGTGHDAPVVSNPTPPPANLTEAAAFTSFGDEGYGTEFRWNVNELTDNTGAALETGTFYKIQVIEHDGDQNKGGDSGEFCTLIKIPGPPQIKTDPTGGTDITGPNVDSTTLKQWLGTNIKDTAFIPAKAGFGNPTGTVTFHLYFDAGNAPTTCASPSDTPPGVEITDGVHSYFDQKTLNATNDPSVATSGTYNTALRALGTYYWQDVFTPGGANAGSYTTVTEACGAEADQMYNGRVRLTPHTAINIVGNDHVIHAFVETIGAGDANWSAVSGAPVTATVNNPPTAAVFHPTTANQCTTASGQSNPSGTYCNVIIKDDLVETVLINASSTFTATGVSGGVNGDDSLTRATDNSASCASDNATGETCEAIKHYINPKTELTVSDRLIGLGATADGSVTYTAWKNDSGCTAGQGTDEGTFTVTNGTAPLSNSVTVTPGDGTVGNPTTTTWYFEASYTGNEGTFTTPCTAETASSG